MWNVDRDENAKFFDGSIKLISENAATMLNNTALVAYTAHVHLQYLSARKRRESIDIGHTLVRFLPVRCILEQIEIGEGAKEEEMWVCGLS